MEKILKRILITGVAGFLVFNLLEQKPIEGHHVISIDKFSIGSLENLPNNLYHQNFVFKKENISEESVFENLGSIFNFILHLTSYKPPRYGNTLSTLKINLKGTENVLEYPSKLKYRFIPASNSHIYDMNMDMPFIGDSDVLMGNSKVTLVPYNKISRGIECQARMRRTPITTKARKVLGITVKTPLEEGVRLTFKRQNKISMEKKEFV